MSTPRPQPLLPSTSRLEHHFITGGAVKPAREMAKAAACASVRVSHARIRSGARSRGPPPADDSLKRCRLAAPVLEDHASIRLPQQVAEHQRCDDRIVQGPGDRDELRHQIDRRRDPDDREPQPQLGASRHPRISQQTAEQHQQVGDQRGELACLRSAASRSARPRSRSSTP